jgi:glucose-1-phosphate thymidylyltransferase
MSGRAVVLARGLGRRMRAGAADAALSPEQQRAADQGFKGMMPIAGRPFLDFVLGTLADAGLTSVAVVVAPGRSAAHDHYVEHPPRRVHLDFVVQQEALGTANAVLAAEAWTRGAPFCVVNSDNLYPPDVLRRLARLEEPGLPLFPLHELLGASNIPEERVKSFAIAESDGLGYLKTIVEKPSAAQLDGAGAHATISMNCWRFDPRIFRYCREVRPSSRGEYELPDAVSAAIADGVRFRTIEGHGPVLDLSQRADVADLERRLSGIVPQP